MDIAKLILGIIAGVLVSLLIVWLLSQWTGMRFDPSLVAALSGSTGAVILLTQRRSRAGD